MPAIANVVLCALVELAIGLAVGLPLARTLARAWPLALALSPTLGAAVFNTLALPILTATGFTRTTVGLLCGAVVLVGVITGVLRSNEGAPQPQFCNVLPYIVGAAALAAILPALAVYPKHVAGGIVLSEAMFDHSKAAIVDDIVRLGLPPGNPFLAGAGPRLVYYYLWHFSAALPAAIVGASGWEADIALTWYTAFASLCLMIGVATSLGGGKAASFVVPLSVVVGSARPLLGFVFSADFLDRALAPYPWPEGWLFQASWAPQHLASASCVIVAAWLVARLATTRDWRLVPLLGVMVAAGFESSAWIGGVVFAPAALAIGLAMLIIAEGTGPRLDLTLKALVAAALAAVIALPFVRDQLLATAARKAGPPIAFHPFEVLGPLAPVAIRRLLDVPAYWAILLPLQLPAVWFTGCWALAMRFGARSCSWREKRFVVGLALLAGAGFTVPWLFASTIANNDLGWRGVLPGVLVLTIFAATGLARWFPARPGLAATATVFWLLGIPGGLEVVRGNAVGLPESSAAAFAQSPELWAAVRRYTAPDERVANNPSYLADEVRWPINISWALLADRRSCFAGWNLARAFAPWPEAEIDRISDLFERVFAGGGDADDVHALASRFDCRAVVITPSDGAWRHDPFAASPDFRRVEENPNKWRIYRVSDGARERK